MFIKSKKSAKLTIEISLMFSLLVVICIAGLSIFGGSLANMITHSGISNFFNASSAKTEFVANNYTQENVQVTASQGIFRNIEDAQQWTTGTINALLKKSESQNLDNNDLEKLAKAYAVANVQGIQIDGLTYFNNDINVSQLGLILKSEKKYGNMTYVRQDNLVKYETLNPEQQTVTNNLFIPHFDNGNYQKSHIVNSIVNSNIQIQ